MMIPRVFGKLCFVDIFMIVNALYFDLCFRGWFASKVTKLSEHLKMHGSSICFNRLMELLTLHHQFGARVCTGLPPDNGYVLKAFFTKKKEIDMHHVRFSWKAAPSVVVADKWWLSALLMAYFITRGRPTAMLNIQTMMIMMNLDKIIFVTHIHNHFLFVPTLF